MTQSDKKKAQLLAVLLMIAGATWYFVVYRPANLVSAVPGTAAKSGSKAAAPKAIGDAQILLGLLDEKNVSSAEVGRKNIFQYRQKPLTPKPPEPPRIEQPVITPLPPRNTVVATTAPQPAPFKAFRYEGYSSTQGRLIASLSEGTNSYQVTEGECLMGQYCIRRLTESMVEIEDLQLKRRQTFPRVQQ